MLLQIDEKSYPKFVAGPNAGQLPLLAAFTQTKALFDEANFAGAKSREDLMSKLDAAISDSGKSVNLTI